MDISLQLSHFEEARIHWLAEYRRNNILSTHGRQVARLRPSALSGWRFKSSA